jgi:ADP-ribosylglycohydrolase
MPFSIKNILFVLLFSFCNGLQAQQQTKLTRAELYDKVLGMLVGSAIGDAMGAPTEMWSRSDIQLTYGFVDKLDSMVREPSGEGTWAWNLPAGGTTDDTRWKKLTVEYLLTENKSGDLTAAQFAKHIMKQYENDIKQLKNTTGFEPEPYENAIRRMAWLQEWARVAKPFVDKDYLAYNDAISRFYGGEMVCAGLLYAPAIGAFYPANPQKAYQQMYKLSIFDIGYARDLSSMAAAMTAAAMQKGATQETLISLFREIDPQNYFKSRLVGRKAFSLLYEARLIVNESQKMPKDDLLKDIFPKNNHLKVDSLYMMRMYHAYKLLDKKIQPMPFHASEITLEVLTAMLFADFDFEKTMAFLINLGRDNDTTSAVAGGILGAFWGFEKLPEAMKQKILTVNKQQLNTDFEALANQMTDKIMSRQ